MFQAALALALLVWAGAPANAQQRPHPAVVRVIAAEPGGASLGSGTLVDVNDEHGLVVTNWHVVRDAPGTVIAVFPDGFQSLGRVLRMDANWDLAAILIEKPQAAPVRVAGDAPQIGETLTIAGYGGGSYRAVAGPCTQYLAPSVQHPQELVELAATARQGDSGGPIFNSRGELAGVLFGEAAGRTTGAYCGRVHTFLAAAVQQLYPADATTFVAQAAPSFDPRASANSAAPATHSHSAHGKSASRDWATNLAAEGWQGGPSPSADEQMVSDSPRTSGPAEVGPDSTAAASFYSATPAPPGIDTDVAAAGPGTVAAIGATAAETGARGENLASIRSVDDSRPQHQEALVLDGPSNAEGRPVARTDTGETGALGWRFFAGETLLAQVKTILACIGLAAIVFHGTRAFAQTTTGKSSSKRAKK